MAEKLPPPLALDIAEARGVEVLGTCDWGGCDREAWGARWDRDTEQYLTVCRQCSKGAGAVRPGMRR